MRLAFTSKHGSSEFSLAVDSERLRGKLDSSVLFDVGFPSLTADNWVFYEGSLILILPFDPSPAAVEDWQRFDRPPAVSFSYYANGKPHGLLVNLQEFRQQAHFDLLGLMQDRVPFVVPALSLESGLAPSYMTGGGHLLFGDDEHFLGLDAFPDSYELHLVSVQSEAMLPMTGRMQVTVARVRATSTLRCRIFDACGVMSVDWVESDKNRSKGKVEALHQALYGFWDAATIPDGVRSDLLQTIQAVTGYAPQEGAVVLRPSTHPGALLACQAVSGNRLVVRKVRDVRTTIQARSIRDMFFSLKRVLRAHSVLAKLPVGESMTLMERGQLAVDINLGPLPGQNRPLLVRFSFI